MRRIILFSVLLISIGAIAYTLLVTHNTNGSITSSLNYVSDDAILILEVDDAAAFRERLRSGSVLWPVASKIPGPREFESRLSDLDRLLSSSYLQSPDSSFGYSISLHPHGQQSRSWLLVIPKVMRNQESLPLFTADKGYQFEEFKVYEGHHIYKAIHDGSTYFLAKEDDALLISTSDICLEKQLRANSVKIIENKGFNISRRTKSSQSPAHLHIDWNNLGPHLELLLPGEEDPHFAKAMGSWATSDLITDANSIYLNGLVQVGDSLDLHLGRYRDQGAGDFEPYLSMIPSITSSFIYKHITDHAAWHELPLKNDSSFFSALAAGSVEFQIENSSETSYLLKIRDQNRMQEWLKLQGSPNDILGFPTTIGNTPSEVLRLTNNKPGDDSTFFATEIQGFLLISTDSEIQRQCLLNLRSARTLSNDESFGQLQDDMDNSASLLYYYNIARLASNLADKEFGPPLDQLPSQQEELKKFQALIIQYEPAGEHSFHQQVLLRHNPVYKKETSSIWELALERPILGRIHGIKNHYNNQLEVLVQDDSLSLHLIDNKGEILWSKMFNEPILSPLEQIDIFKNGKLQMIFNTETGIYVLDRNGNDVDGFPIALPESASTSIAVMDYDQNKNYRLLIGLSNGELMNFGADGQPVKGWKHKPMSESLIGQIRHFTIGKKDFITTIGESGTLQFLQRNGKVRYEDAACSLPSYDGGFYRIQPGKNIESTMMFHRNAQDELLMTTVKGPSEVLEESASIHPLKPDRFFTSERGRYRLFNSRSETRLDIRTEIESMTVRLDDEAYTGLIDEDKGLFYLYDNSGTLLKGFPLPGSASYIGDMNKDGVKDIILADDDSVLYMYSLD